jgi:hypothetical protein
MSQMTPRQHYVPDFYLRQWADANGKITCHDIPRGKTFTCDPGNALVQSYFYEEDPAVPDNRIENMLSAMEGPCSITFKKLHEQGQIAVRASDQRKAASTLQSLITDDDLDNLGSRLITSN